MIGIIDYGMGNLFSVQHALDALGYEWKMVCTKEEMESCDRLILPGVGAFPDCVKNLKSHGVFDTIGQQVRSGKPLLGICLGMQVLFEKGYEGVECEGLGLLKGSIVKMVDDTVKIPHIGWNRLEIVKEDSLYQNVSAQPFVYFVHSYFAQNYDEDALVSYSEYGSLKIPAYVRKRNVMGMQYHPEKSGKEGMAMLDAFCGGQL